MVVTEAEDLDVRAARSAGKDADNQVARAGLRLGKWLEPEVTRRVQACCLDCSSPWVLGVALAFLLSWRLIREGIGLYPESGRTLRVLALILVKWVSRILEFGGFIVGFVMGWSLRRRERSRKLTAR